MYRDLMSVFLNVHGPEALLTYHQGHETTYGKAMTPMNPLPNVCMWAPK